MVLEREGAKEGEREVFWMRGIEKMVRRRGRGRSPELAMIYRGEGHDQAEGEKGEKEREFIFHVDSSS